jgi:predicted ATPase
MRLLAKTAEDRYQSAAGVQADLEDCLRQLRGTESIRPFPLARYDRPRDLRLPERLYGRERELALLNQAFARASQGFQELLLVTGSAGIGKTSLVRELQKPVVESRGLFVSGKFDQVKRDLPYAAVIEAFQGLVRELLAQGQDEILAWRDRLRLALGPNGRVIVDVIPEVALIVGEPPSVPELPPAETHNRFSLVFQSFVGAFCRPESPLVLFLDDLQWADNASLGMLRLLMTVQHGRCLLLVGAFRDNEIDGAHPLRPTLDEITRAGATVTWQTLGPLCPEDVQALMSDALGLPGEACADISQLVFARTQGNPFFLVELLRALHEDGMLWFDAAAGRWRWDAERIVAAGIPDDVVDLMATRLERLPPGGRRALELAACIGNAFGLETLAHVTGSSPGELARALEGAVLEGLITPQGDAYRHLQLGGRSGEDLLDASILKTVRYRFCHDKIQQAAYARIPVELVPTLHLQIGRILVRETAPERLHDCVFDLVNQLNAALELVHEPQERVEFARLNLLAGRRAKTSSAYTAARGYLQAGLGLLDRGGWSTHYDLALELHAEAAEAAYLTMHFGEMETLVEQVFANARTELDKVQAAEVRIAGYVARGRKMEAIDTALRMLHGLDVRLPPRPHLGHILGALARVKLALARRSGVDLRATGQAAEPRIRAAIRLASSVASTAYVACPNLFPVLVLRQVELSIKHGYTNVTP